MAQNHVVHENAARAAPLFDVLEHGGLPHRDRHLAEGAVDLTEAPPEGVFYNRTSASSHTRDHRLAPDPEAETRVAISGMAALATVLGRELSALRRRAGAAPAAD